MICILLIFRIEIGWFDSSCPMAASSPSGLVKDDIFHQEEVSIACEERNSHLDCLLGCQLWKLVLEFAVIVEPASRCEQAIEPSMTQRLF